MPERGSPNSNNSLDVGSLLPFDEVGEVVEGSRAKLHVPPPKPQWKGHVYFLGGVLYVNILFASPADVHGHFLPLQPGHAAPPIAT